MPHDRMVYEGRAYDGVWERGAWVACDFWIGRWRTPTYSHLFVVSFSDQPGCFSKPQDTELDALHHLGGLACSFHGRLLHRSLCLPALLA